MSESSQLALPIESDNCPILVVIVNPSSPLLHNHLKSNEKQVFLYFAEIYTIYDIFDREQCLKTNFDDSRLENADSTF